MRILLILLASTLLACCPSKNVSKEHIHIIDTVEVRVYDTLEVNYVDSVWSGQLSDSLGNNIDVTLNTFTKKARVKVIKKVPIDTSISVLQPVNNVAEDKVLKVGTEIASSLMPLWSKILISIFIIIIIFYLIYRRIK